MSGSDSLTTFSLFGTILGLDIKLADPEWFPGSAHVFNNRGFDGLSSKDR